MNLALAVNQLNFAVGESGGSNNQSEIVLQARRGLEEQQADPLVIWWVKLLKSDNSVDGHVHQSYRRSRWNHPAKKTTSSVSPYFAMHKQSVLRSLTLSALMIIGITASLNTVAKAETMPSARSALTIQAEAQNAAAGSSTGLAEMSFSMAADPTTQTRSLSSRTESPMPTGSATTFARETTSVPYAERFSRMKEFVGKHNQYLDLSKLNEFKWSDDAPITAHARAPKAASNATFQSNDRNAEVQPPAVNRTYRK